MNASSVIAFSAGGTYLILAPIIFLRLGALKPRPEWAGTVFCLTVPAFILWLSVVALLSILYAFIAVLFLDARERRLFRRLQAQQRTLPWHDVEQHLQAGSGTLIIEQAQKQRRRLWWTPDNVPSLSPVPIPAFDDLDFLFLKPPQPFVTWCFERYLSSPAGSALLTRPTGLKFPNGFTSPEFFTTLFPSARVVATTLMPQRKNDRRA